MDFYDEVVEIKKPNPIDKTSELGVLNVSDNLPSTSGHMQELLKQKHGRPTSSLSRTKKPAAPPKRSDSFGSESESSDTETKEDEPTKAFMINHKEWVDLDVSGEIKEIFQYILRYTPPRIEIDYNLQPFIPEYIPAVGDIDAFLKVLPPKPLNDKRSITDHIDKLGLEILDEPSGKQSEPALLHMKLRSISTQPRTPGPPPSIATSAKDIDNWIAEVQMLQINQPYPMVINSKPMQDIDALMVEWPTDMERVLNNLGFPSAYLNCPLTFYIELICSLLDISIPATKTQADYIYVLHTLFNLYIAIKNSVD